MRNVTLMSQSLIKEKSTLVQVMAWCRQAIENIAWTKADLDLFRHMASSGHYELSRISLQTWYSGWKIHI